MSKFYQTKSIPPSTLEIKLALKQTTIPARNWLAAQIMGVAVQASAAESVIRYTQDLLDNAQVRGSDRDQFIEHARGAFAVAHPAPARHIPGTLR